MTLSGDNRTVSCENGDPGSSFSYEIRDLGPQFPKILGTLGSPFSYHFIFSYHIRDSSIKLGTPLQFYKGAVLALHKGAVVAYYTNYTILYLKYTYYNYKTDLTLTFSMLFASTLSIHFECAK